MNLLTKRQLPPGFNYPKSFLSVVDRNLLHFEPWVILTGDQLRTRNEGLRKRYPERSLVPFARREDNDDVACWQATHPHAVVIVHDYASPGWEERRQLTSFHEWLRLALEDMIEFDLYDS